MILSTCGLKCNECEYFNSSCRGCREERGSVFWAVEMMPDKICPLYKCAVKLKGYADCGLCPDLPCETFRHMKDPALSDEQHLQMIGVRAALLRSLRD